MQRNPDELDNYSPRVAHVDARYEILNIDREVATRPRARTLERAQRASTVA